jgi:PAS domain S-box-containing protein
MKTSALSQYSNNLVIKTNAQWAIEEVWAEKNACFKQTEHWLQKPLQHIIIFSEQDVFMNELKKFKLSNNKTVSFQTFILNEKKKKFAAELIIQKKFKTGIINHFIINVQQIQSLQLKPKSFPVPLLLRETILDNIHAAILILNKNGEITYLNKAGERITGYNFATIANKNWFELFVPENELEKTIAIFQKIKSGEESIDHENAIITKQKNRKIIQWKNTAIYSGKTFQRTLSIGLDVTELKNAYDAIKQSERKFQSITEAIPIGLSICETNGKVLYMNQAFRQMFGYKVSERKSVHDWFNRAYPNKASAEQAKKRWNAHVKNV